MALSSFVLQSMSSSASQNFAPSEVPKFDNTTLKRLFLELFSDFGAAPIKDSDFRPQKRVRKSTETPSRNYSGTSADALQDLDLLLGWEASLDLAGLQERIREVLSHSLSPHSLINAVNDLHRCAKKTNVICLRPLVD